MRLEHTFHVPVLTTDVHAFIHRARTDEFHPVAIAQKSLAFIQNAVQPYNVKFPFLFEEVLQELIENCYDSYAKKGLVVGEELRITLIIQEKDSQLCIKLKDNGSGFAHKEKGKYFMVANIAPEQKEHTIFNGGEGIGLRSMEAELRKATIGLFFKNRKESGATAYLMFSNLALRHN